MLSESILVAINPYVMNGLGHHFHLDESTLMFRGVRSGFRLV